MKKTVAYIAGPMTGKPDGNRAAFYAAEKRLSSEGFIVLNPAVFPDSLEHHQYMVMCLAMLEQSGVIYMLPGWRDSKGACIEHRRARELGLMIVEGLCDAVRVVSWPAQASHVVTGNEGVENGKAQDPTGA